MTIRQWVGGLAVAALLGCGHSPPVGAVGSTTEYMMVKKGDRAWPVQDQALARNLERQLAANGYDPGRTDGVVDARVRATLAEFQRAKGLVPSGILDKQTADALGLQWGRVSGDLRAGRLEQNM